MLGDVSLLRICLKNEMNARLGTGGTTQASIDGKSNALSDNLAIIDYTELYVLPYNFQERGKGKRKR